MLNNSRAVDMLPFPPGTAAGGLDFMPLELSFIFASNGPINPFLLFIYLFLVVGYLQTQATAVRTETLPLDHQGTHPTLSF